jgi:hypothetical protein
MLNRLTRRLALLFALALSVMTLAAASQTPQTMADDTSANASDQGHVDLHDIGFNHPALASFLLILLPSPHDGSSETNPVTLNRLHLDFQHSSDKLVIRNGSVCHDAFVATIDGYASLPAGDLHFRGVLWPLFENTALSADLPAPLIAIKNRARNVFPLGMSYRMDGSYAEPILRFNPFPDEYPGDLRRVTESCNLPPPR